MVHGCDEAEVVQLEEGLSIVSNGDVNDPRDERVKMAQRLLTLQTLDSPVKFLAVASKVFARAPSPPGRPSMVVRNKDRGHGQFDADFARQEASRCDLPIRRRCAGLRTSSRITRRCCATSSAAVCAKPARRRTHSAMARSDSVFKREPPRTRRRNRCHVLAGRSTSGLLIRYLPAAGCFPVQWLMRNVDALHDPRRR